MWKERPLRFWPLTDTKFKITAFFIFLEFVADKQQTQGPTKKKPETKEQKREPFVSRSAGERHIFLL